VKGVLNLETICDCGSHGSSGEWWNANVEQVVIDVLATAVPTGFQMHLRSMATLATCTTSSAGTRITVYSVTPAQLPQIPLCPTEERILALMGFFIRSSTSCIYGRSFGVSCLPGKA